MAGNEVIIELAPEGPQRGDLAEDISAALAANPAAAAFFDTLAQFYRKAYLRWIDATTRRPDLRAARIAEVVDLLGPGSKSGDDCERESQPSRWRVRIQVSEYAECPDLNPTRADPLRADARADGRFAGVSRRSRHVMPAKPSARRRRSARQGLWSLPARAVRSR
ncbi:MAG: YdeI/OmpD-associated family protein [Streptosporangiaceae bacterium]